MIQEQEAETAAWLSNLPGPAFSIFSVPDRDRATQVPVLLQLLEIIGYPDVAGLADDLNNGFDMLGVLRPWPGWRPRSDDKYSCPASLESLRSANLAYVRDKIRHGRPGPHAKELLQEVVE